MVVTPRNDYLDELIEQATVDAYSEDEQLSGFQVMIEENLALPFETMVLGVSVRVVGIEERPAGLAAVCRREGHRQEIDLLDLPLPEPGPAGAEWIEAFRRWAGWSK